MHNVGQRMRRFEIGSAEALVWVAVSLALWCGSAAPASAQTYDFSFKVQGVQGSALFVTNGSRGLITGSTLTFPSTVSGTLNTSGTAPGAPGYGTTPMLLSTSSQPYFPGPGADDPVFLMSNGEYDFLSQNTLYVESSPGIAAYSAFGLTNQSLTERTPAPVPGSGLLSYLMFGLGALFINRKRLWRAARMASFGYRGGRHAPVQDRHC
jgi:hypothetical protein